MSHCLVSHYSMFGLILITFTKSNILSLLTKTGNLWTGWILWNVECFQRYSMYMIVKLKCI